MDSDVRDLGGRLRRLVVAIALGVITSGIYALLGRMHRRARVPRAIAPRC